ncbi:hypothetical protein, partial [Salmonella enterica]|uniref:hypothetical protein n=1 Tax=Salmonella enterica TaxID=28901 RepID=UPI003CEBF436
CAACVNWPGKPRFSGTGKTAAPTLPEKRRFPSSFSGGKERNISSDADICRNLHFVHQTGGLVVILSFSCDRLPFMIGTTGTTATTA